MGDNEVPPLFIVTDIASIADEAFAGGGIEFLVGNGDANRGLRLES